MKTKTIFTLLLAFFSFTFLLAQEGKEEMKLLFHPKDGHQKIANGGYGAFSIGWTQINGQGAILLGGRAAWIANHYLAFGLAGSGFFNDFYNGNSYRPEEYFLAGGYGGLLIEPILMPMKPVHVSFPIIFGAGGVTAAPPGSWDGYNHGGGYYYDNYYYDTDAFFVFQPGLEVEFNIVKFFRIALGASYRFTDGINLQYKYFDNNNVEKTVIVDSKALNAFNASITFKFGWF
ncbi:MAG: hypothetical protein L3J31_01260 [Bacteroidales bacterium]|nr:hypothetical protein [Bacteroidales bacterium]MCF6341418.1 hypothetical protein [Bacteroidales bacterium]